MSCPNYKIIFNDETKYVAQDITEEPVVRVIPARGEPGPQGEKGPQGEQGPQGIQGEQGPKGEDGKNFEPTVVSALPTTGEEGKLYLTPKAHTTQTATGNPITANVAEEAGAIESFQLDGDTYQQSYTGKNLFDYASANARVGYILNDNGVEVTDRSGGYTRNYSSVTPNSEYILSGLDTIGGKTRRVYFYDSNKQFLSRTAPITTGSPTLTFTTPANCYFVNIQIFIPEDEDMSAWQLEAGSTATDYEPFVGGQPSPSPEYPRPIQTVTGTQTININGTDYPLDLGDIELNGLGDDGNGNPLYKDRIYRDGDDWKVHKETDYAAIDSLSDGNSYSINTNSTNTTRVLINSCLNLQGIYAPIEVRSLAKCNYFIYASNWGSDIVGFFTDTDAQATKNGLCFRAPKTVVGTTEETVETWLNDHPLKVNYILLTPTDITITDTNLIAQLEAIRTASLENGMNTITNTATGSNLAGDMEIGYYGFAPRNRYDKWLWLDINNEYEQLNNPDTTTQNLNSGRSLNLTNIQSDSNEIKNDEEQEDVTFNDVEDL